MKLSEPAVAFLNTFLMEAADGLVLGDGYVSVLDQPTIDECRARLQAWRDGLSAPCPVVSRALVEQAAAALGAHLSGVPLHSPELARARVLLTEALGS